MLYSSFEDAVDAILRKHPEYAPDAYDFMREALEATSRDMAEAEERTSPHLSAYELYMGFCAYALSEYGPLAAAVMEHWGIDSSSDVGNIVYNLIEVGVFGKQAGDTREQFDNLCPLRTVLDTPYLPEPVTDR